MLRHNGKIPSSREQYLLAFSDSYDDAFATAVWKNFSPRKCKFFLWLLHRRRLRTNARLNYCHMNSSGQCPFCSEDEDCFHLFVKCRRSTSFWTFLGLDLNTLSSDDNVEALWVLNPLQEPDARIRSSVLICILWNMS